MYQQINLYQPVFRQQRKIFSARTLLLILVVVTVLLLALYVHARWTLAALNHTATSIEEQYRQMETQLGNLEIVNQSADSGALDSEIERLRHSINEQQSILDGFDKLAVRSAAGFGEFFDALARQTLPGLWLTGIRLTQDGETELRGITLDPKLVPDYLQLLPDQPRFRSLQQGSLHLVRHEPDDADIEFRIRSKGLEEF
jgi:cell division protein FtsL